MSTVPKNLQKIRERLDDVSIYDDIRIDEKNGQIKIHVQPQSFFQAAAAEIAWRVDWFLGYFWPVLPKQAHEESTRSYFQKIFGKGRIERLEKQYDFSLKDDGIVQRRVTVRDIEILFTGVSIVSFNDLEELFYELREGRESIRGLHDTQCKVLHHLLQTKTSIADCSKEEIDRLYSILVPFKNSDCFIQEAPRLDSTDAITLPLTTFEMHRQVAYILQTLREKKWSSIEWANYIGKRVAIRDPEIGTIIPHPNGYYEVFQRIEINGACATLLRPVGSNTFGLLPVVLFRGTRSCFPCDLKSPKAVVESLKEDIFEEIGKLGIISCYDLIKKYLCDPDYGFVNNQQQKLWGIGYSLGGTQIQRMAILFPERFNCITTVGSPGIEEESALLYATLLKEKKLYPTIDHIIDFDDFIPLFGGYHIGYKCETGTANVTVHVYKDASTKIGTSRLQNIATTLFSTLVAHSRTAHMLEHEVFRFSSLNEPISIYVQQAAQQAGNHAEWDWEFLRKFLALKTSRSFSAFVKEKSL